MLPSCDFTILPVNTDLPSYNPTAGTNPRTWSDNCCSRRITVSGRKPHDSNVRQPQRVQGADHVGQEVQAGEGDSQVKLRVEL